MSITMEALHDHFNELYYEIAEYKERTGNIPNGISVSKSYATILKWLIVQREKLKLVDLHVGFTGLVEDQLQRIEEAEHVGIEKARIWGLPLIINETQCEPFVLTPKALLETTDVGSVYMDDEFVGYFVPTPLTYL